MLPSGYSPALKVARGGHLKTAWAPTRIELFYWDGWRRDFPEEAVLGTGVEGSLKATLRERSVLGGISSVLNQGGERVRAPIHRTLCSPFQLGSGYVQVSSWKGREKHRLAQSYRLNVFPPNSQVEILILSVRVLGGGFGG